MKARRSFYCCRADYPVIKHVLYKNLATNIWTKDVPGLEHRVHVTFDAQSQKAAERLQLIVIGIKDTLTHLGYEGPKEP